MEEVGGTGEEGSGGGENMRREKPESIFIL